MSKVEEAMTYLLDSVKGASGFVQEQAPLYIQEYLRYEFISCVLFGSLFFLLFAVGLCGMVVSFRNRDEDWADIFGLCSLFIALVFLLPTCLIFDRAIKVKLAPRVAVMEHISKTLKGE